MNFSDPKKMICVLTDAFDCFYPGLVTQKDKEQLYLQMKGKDRLPLANLLDEFKSAQQRQTVP
jgi:hypothetical protein